MRDTECSADGVCERVIGPHERVREGEPRESGGVGHVGAGREVGRIVVRTGQRVEDESCGLDAERVGVRGSEDRGDSFQCVGERVDAGVDGQCARHGEGQRRIHDRHVRDEGVVDEGLLAARDGQHRGR